MRVFGSSFGSWRMIERQEGVQVPHGLTFPLAVLREIGRPHGLEMVAEEDEPAGPLGYDAIFVSVMDARCMVPAAEHFRAWRMPLRRRDRSSDMPLVWAGGQGLHNPLPLAEVADLIVVGDAEDPLPVLFSLWYGRRDDESFLADAAGVPGVFVPSVHDERTDRVVQSVSSDVGITLRSHISVAHDGSRRIEIARGCKFGCAFCSLGWRAPVRENRVAEISEELARSPVRVNLQAGDAESHTDIDEIRAAVDALDRIDLGWTGRLDTTTSNPDATTPATKRYAFGVEGLSYRLRRAVGKGYLTDDRLVESTLLAFRRATGAADTPRHRPGRAMWHLIAGLPGERLGEIRELLAVLKRIDHGCREIGVRNLRIGWQPFEPLPGTPMQWFGAGTGARKLAGMISGAMGRMPFCRVSQSTGRTDRMSQICAVLARSDRRGVDLLRALGEDAGLSAERAEDLAGVTFGDLDPDGPLPWDFVEHAYPRDVLRKAYRAVVSRLGAAPSCRG